MQKPKQKVNAKLFLEDFRAGKSNHELMRIHGLNSETLKKLLDLLIEKGLLQPSELKPASQDRETGRSLAPVRSAPISHVPRESPEDPATRCPQCKAQVTGKMLICPECGHVLPGEERWARVEPKKRFVDRVPPWVLGMLLAFPMVIALLLVYRDIIFPITTATIERKSEELRKQSARKHPGAATLPATAADSRKTPVDALIDQLTADDILSSVNDDYTVFRISKRWFELSPDHKVLCLDHIRKAMKQSSVEKIDFEVVDLRGQLIAWVTEDVMQFGSGQPQDGPGAE